jgi:hypothetical protein
MNKGTEMTVITRLTLEPAKTNAHRNAKCKTLRKNCLSLTFLTWLRVAGNNELYDGSSSKFFKTQKAAVTFAESRTFN